MKQQMLLLKQLCLTELQFVKLRKNLLCAQRASSRFEKGINEGTVREALDFAAAMIVELAGGKFFQALLNQMIINLCYQKFQLL